jgi:hypothetical protein
VEYAQTHYVVATHDPSGASHARRIQEENERHGYRNASPVKNAMTQIFEAAGEPQLHFSLSGHPEGFDRIKARAGNDSIKDSHFTYTDLFGMIHVPFDVTVGLAQALCAVEPATVLINIGTSQDTT